MLTRLLLSAALGVIATTAHAQSFNQTAYCEAMAEQANAGKVISLPIPEATLASIYKRGEAPTNRPMYQVLLTGEGDLAPYNAWLSETCNGLTLTK